MKRSILTLSFALALSLLNPTGFTANAAQCLYLSAGGKLSVFEIDARSGELTPFQEIELAGAGPMGPSPDGKLLYVNAQLIAKATGGAQPKRGTPGIATFRVKKDGSLEHLLTAPVNIGPGYLRADKHGRFLAGNHYGPGKATIWKLDGKGIYRGETVQEVELEQRAHSAVFSPDNRFLLVPATGPNKVFQLRFDEKTGRATPNDPPSAPGPQGDDEARQPRHLVFHPEKDIVYTTNEREHPGVGVWKWDADKGRLETIQNIVTQPKGFGGNITTADLHLTPDGKFLYVSNRDVTDRKARGGTNHIVAFAVDGNSGRLELIGHYPCEHVPRSFRIDDTGNFLYVAGQGDDKLGVYRIDGKSGALTKVTQYGTGARPSWVHCMTP